MAQATSIEWTEQVWNFLRGCKRVSSGCGIKDAGGCYAERQAIRHAGPGGAYEGLVRMTPNGPRWTGEISFHEDILLAPSRRKKPTTYFVNSMSDLFYEKVSDEILDKAFAVMALTPQHTYQILTKRPERMLEYFASRPPETHRVHWLPRQVSSAFYAIELKKWDIDGRLSWPLPNVWLGVSVEDQKTAAERIPLLLQTPAAIRWISAEPLLGPIDLTNLAIIRHDDGFGDVSINALTGHIIGPDDMTDMMLDWVVVGGESGPGARACDIAWIRSIVGQCKAASVPVFCKQLGSRPVGSALDNSPAFPVSKDIRMDWDGRGVGSYCISLKDRKGGEPSEWPLDLRIRQMPEVV